MLHAKISAAILVVLLALMGFAYVSLSGSVTGTIIYEQNRELFMAVRAVDGARYTGEHALHREGDALANEETMISELTRLNDLVASEGSISPLKKQQNRQAVFELLLEWSAQRQQKFNSGSKAHEESGAESSFHGNLHDSLGDWWGAKPDLALAFISTPLKAATGHILVAHAEVGQELRGGLNYTASVAVLSKAEKSGKPETDLIAWNDSEYLAVAAPVFSSTDGSQVGTVLLGYQLGAGLVSRLADVTGDQVGVIVFSLTDGERLYVDESVPIRDELFDATFYPVTLGENEAFIDKDQELSLAEVVSDTPYMVEAAGHEYLFVRHDWCDDVATPRVGHMVLAHFGEAIQPVKSLQFDLIIVGIILLLLGLILTQLILRSFLRPFEDIDVGIREILAGNAEYVFSTSSGGALHAGLAHNLNNLLAFLQGRDAEADDAKAWQALMVDLKPERPSMHGLDAVSAVKDEAEREGLRTLYDTYMAERQKLDQHVEMDFERFCRRIKRNEASLKEKHGCSSVEFDVAVADGKVVLKPRPIFA